MTTQQTVLSVDGMTCPSCARHVASALRELGGVKQVDVRLREGEVVVEHGLNGPSPNAMIAALNEAGYPSRAG